MQLQLFTIALLSSSASALAPHQRRQDTIGPAFSSAANQLISLYVPAAGQSAILSAASAASITGDPQSIINSALAATVVPSWLAAVPTEYQSCINSVESAISGLRGAASTGIAGAPRVATATNSAGSTFITIIPPSSVSIAAASSVTGSVASITGSVATSLSSVLSSVSSVSNSAASSAPSSAVSAASSTASSAASATSSAVSSVANKPSAVTSHTASSSTSSGFAAPTQVPIAAAGVIGLLGMVLAV
ncbi:hypothetical protein K432DRAFT_430546 [Lepidopterella palustris CBS 459.81]|uniref:Uncharacterized protein n=1 Tax=Lepidopterella palustris CBS 459.81 TaxID=1314670 RepID=A0A8E2J8S1_9PEZI|nr:hypothetical protein K432DRAFT_430546 [Lepidopterella palustris CBS 459.81]